MFAPKSQLPPMPSPQSSPASGRGSERKRQSSIPAGEGVEREKPRPTNPIFPITRLKRRRIYPKHYAIG
ncbi:MAG: hypothetical protein EPN14_03360 [Gallionella sp.]|nr:MAG: hypothetical protein EPN14_03360 [Gallionella sp.]